MMETDRRHILVTGGAGFIGSHLVHYLVGLGHHVTVLDNFSNGTRANLEGVSDPRRLRILQGDITDPAMCREACSGAEIVFHLACLGVRHSLHDPVLNHQVNALGSLNMLEAARAAHPHRFVYVSSSEVYGRVTDFPIREETATWPLTVYGGGKLAGEHYARAYRECFGVPTICVRPFNNYGPRSHFEGDSGEVIPRFLLRALAGQPPIIFGDGSHTRDFLYVGDCVEALWQIAGCDGLVGQVVNLGFGQEISIGSLAETVLRAVGRTDLKPVFEAPRPADVPRLWVDVRKLRSHMPFQPKTSLEKGIAATLAYFSKMFAADPRCLERMVTFNWKAQ